MGKTLFKKKNRKSNKKGVLEGDLLSHMKNDIPAFISDTRKE